MIDSIQKSILVSSPLISLFLVLSSPLFAQDAPPPVEEVKSEKTEKKPAVEVEEQPPTTIVADPGYGSNHLLSRDYFRADSVDAQVDRRDEIDAMADHAILLPTAFTPKQYSTSFTTTNLLLNTLSFSPTDDLQVSASAVLSTEVSDFMFNGSAKLRLKSDENYIVSAQPFFSYQAGHEQLDVANFGIGGGLLADFYISDRMIISTGSFLFLNALHILDQLNYDQCVTHSEFIEGSCINTDSQLSFPSGGHWLSLHASLLYYIYDTFSLRLEAISGLTYGSFLGTEYLDGREGFSARKDNFDNPAFSLGVPKNSILTLGAGVGWAKENFGFKASAYLWRGELEEDVITVLGQEGSQRSSSWFLTPTLSLTIKL